MKTIQVTLNTELYRALKSIAGHGMNEFIVEAIEEKIAESDDMMYEEAYGDGYDDRDYGRRGHSSDDELE